MNPLTGRDLRRADARRVKQLRTVRSNARADARSGHPGRRASGQQARAMAAALIRDVYVADVTGRR